MAAGLKVHEVLVNAEYDRDSDVLYLTVGPAVPVEGAGLPGGVELDFALETGEPSGITVIGFAHNGWAVRIADLAQISADHLGAAARSVLASIEHAVR